VPAAAGWTEAELAEALVVASRSDWAVQLRAAALAQLLDALGRRGWVAADATREAVLGEADQEWLNVTSRSTVTVLDPLAGPGGTVAGWLQAEAVLSCLGRFDTLAWSASERQALPVALTVRLELHLGVAAEPGGALDSQSFRCGTIECSLGQTGRDGVISRAAELVAWFEYAAGVAASVTHARERAHRAETMAAELQFQLAP
jgi:hypothetical protein